jgi:YfiH family protein
MAETGALYEKFSFYFDGEACRGARCVLSLRAAGDMGFGERAGTPARNALCAALGIDAGRVAACRQSHSRRVALAGADGGGGIYDADGLAASGAVVLSVTVADCLPVYLFDTRTKAFALCHSGWKGTGIAREALRLMRTRYGSRARDVAAVLGPCIQSCCYRVDAERAACFQREFGGLAGEYPAGMPVVEQKSADGGTAYFLDMQAANAKLLFDEGVRSITRRPECTFSGAQYGSFRREGTAFTKMMALLYMNAPELTL